MPQRDKAHDLLLRVTRNLLEEKRVHTQAVADEEQFVRIYSADIKYNSHRYVVNLSTNRCKQGIFELYHDHYNNAERPIHRFVHLHSTEISDSKASSSMLYFAAGCVAEMGRLELLTDEACPWSRGIALDLALAYIRNGKPWPVRVGVDYRRKRTGRCYRLHLVRKKSGLLTLYLEREGKPLAKKKNVAEHHIVKAGYPLVRDNR